MSKDLLYYNNLKALADESVKSIETILIKAKKICQADKEYLLFIVDDIQKSIRNIEILKPKLDSALSVLQKSEGWKNSLETKLLESIEVQSWVSKKNKKNRKISEKGLKKL